MELNPDFKEFIELLNLNKVEYIVVGGYAVGFQKIYVKQYSDNEVATESLSETLWGQIKFR